MGVRRFREPTDKSFKSSICLCVALFIFAAVSISAGAPSAFAAETPEFNPTLSLTGGCSTSSVDPVPDPGCPGGTHPPVGPFTIPQEAVTDPCGDIYVASFGKASAEGAEGRIDIFNHEGYFLTEILDSEGPTSLAVDSKGHIYAFAKEKIQRYDPSLYKPKAGELNYEKPPTVIKEGIGTLGSALAVNPANDHLFLHFAKSIVEFTAAEEGNEELKEKIGVGVLDNVHGMGLAIDAAHGRIYASDRRLSPENVVIRVFELAPPHALLQTIDGSNTPNGEFLVSFLTVAADEGTGNFFVFDGEADVVDEFAEDGSYLSAIKYGFEYIRGAKISIDNGKESPNGALNPKGRSLFVPSHRTGIGHVFTFGPPTKCPPTVESTSFSGVGSKEAQLLAKIEPCGLATTYSFEYVPEESYDEEGFSAAVIAGSGELPPGNNPVEVGVPAAGLSPDTDYVFRVVIANEKGSTEGLGRFTTYPAGGASECLNADLRSGPSALLPDCRAYELVTPPDTNARTPRGVARVGSYFATRESSPSGDRVSFMTEGGTLPGSGGTGSLAGDSYLATRQEEGWTTATAGPSGGEAVSQLPGGISPDQGYSFWESGGEGSAAVEGQATSYIRYPDGHSALVGRGSLGTDPRAAGKLISEDGGHIVFVCTNHLGNTPVQLEPNAPPEGTQTVYDRTADEITHVVSLLPGNVTPLAGEDARYVGASLDGQGIAFQIGSTLYLRYRDEETFEIGEGLTFAGIAEGGGRIFYVQSGNLKAFDVEGEKILSFTSSGDITTVNVASGGTAAYFISPTAILGSGPNPGGDEPIGGKKNLYLSEEGAFSFVATVTEADVEAGLEGLGLWAAAVGPGSGELPGQVATDPSRTTPDGTVLLFESRAKLGGYDPEGHVEIYRYDAVDKTLLCLSCNPTRASASGAASLQSLYWVLGDEEPLSAFAIGSNLRSDGKRVFFQSTEALVPGDTDGLQDVYEWEEKGVGSCTRAGGCVYLISSGHSAHVDYLYAVSDSGNDVFFRTSDLLVGRDVDETPSIYDARVGGGFPEVEPIPCQESECRGVVSPPPNLPEPGTPPTGGLGNLMAVHCAKGKHKVIRDGKPICVKKRRHHGRSKEDGKKGAGK